MEKMKYVRLGKDNYNSVIIFPCIIEHSDFREWNPVSAGFCYINQDHVQCFGESASLDLKSDEKEDTFQATKQYCGMEAALKLI